MNAITIAHLSFLCIAANAAWRTTSDFDIRNEAEFRKIFPLDAKVATLADGFGFTEGPVWIPRDGGYLVFSDIQKNRLNKWTAKDGITTFREPSRNANGNTLDRQGRLLTAEHSGRRVSRLERDGSVVTVVDRFDGKKFNSPNDVVIKRDGTIWFTDPPYGVPTGEAKEQAGNYVFRYDPATKRTTVVVKDFDMPKINLPKAGANLTFGGKDGTTLFITARDGLYSVETMVRLQQ